MTVRDSPIKFPPAVVDRQDQPLSEVRALTGDRPVVLVELPDGSNAWLVIGYDEVRQVLVDQRFSRAAAVAPGRCLQGTEMFAAGSINGIDPPEHTRLRRLVASAFTARRVEALRPRVSSIVDGLIDALLDRSQPADLVSGFSLPLPVQVICEMLGVPPDDMARFHAWSDTVMGDWQRDSDVIMTALLDMYGYFSALIEIKRAQPADDLMTALIAARDESDRLTEEELTMLGCTERWRSSCATCRLDSASRQPGWLRRMCSLATSRSRRARSSCRYSPQPTATHRHSATPAGSTSAARRLIIWRSAPACTIAWVPSLPGWSCSKRFWA